MMINTIKKNRFAIAALATIVLATGGIAAADAMGRDRADGPMNFERMDADSNGQVTLAEFQSRMLERFADADEDGDNIVTKVELEEIADGRRGERMVRGLLGMFDINRDEQVTLEEMSNRQQKLLALADMDDSGFISEDEMPRNRFGGGRGFRGN